MRQKSVKPVATHDRPRINTPTSEPCVVQQVIHGRHDVGIFTLDRLGGEPLMMGAFS